MSRAFQLLSTAGFVLALNIGSAQAQWVLHETGVVHVPTATSMVTEFPGATSGGSGGSSGNDGDFWWATHGSDAYFENILLAAAIGDGFVITGVDDSDTTTSYVRGSAYTELGEVGIGDGAMATGTGELARDMIVESSTTPVGTFSLTLTVSIDAGSAITGLTDYYVGSGWGFARAWMGDWEDAYENGEYVYVIADLDSGSWSSYDPVNGWQGGSGGAAEATFTFTGLSGEGQDVHFLAEAQAGFDAQGSVWPGGFTGWSGCVATCDATVAAE